MSKWNSIRYNKREENLMKKIQIENQKGKFRQAIKHFWEIPK